MAAQDFKKGLAADQRGDYATALRQWRPLAEQGDADAQFNVGNAYHTGQGVPQDDAEAVKWYRKAAEQGDVMAQHNLGALYCKGQGVPQDDVLAHMWFSLAAAQGNEEAVKNRGIVERKMWPWNVWKAERLAREWLEKHPR